MVNENPLISVPIYNTKFPIYIIPKQQIFLYYRDIYNKFYNWTTDIIYLSKYFLQDLLH